MHARLGKRLAVARRRRFVGRSAELELFRMALGRDGPDVAVLHIHGPGGMGKTSLLREFAQLAEEVGRLHLPLDGRTLTLPRRGSWPPSTKRSVWRRCCTA